MEVDERMVLALLSLVADVARVVIPALMAALALLITVDQAGFREFQKVVLSQLDALEKSIDEAMGGVCDLALGATFSEDKRKRLDIRFSSCSQLLKNLQRAGIIERSYVRPWVAFKRNSTLAQMDKGDFKARNAGLVDQAAASKLELDSFIREQRLRILESRRRISDWYNKRPFSYVIKCDRVVPEVGNVGMFKS